MGFVYGNYILERRLAVGVTGELFVGCVAGGPRVVVKRIHTDRCNDPDYIDRFLEEARLAALLDHPNLIKITELTNVGGNWCMALECIEGVNLVDIIAASRKRKNPIPFNVAARWIAEVAAGLHYLHTLVTGSGAPMNAVHQNVVPGTIAVTWDGQVKIVDFGTTKHSGSASSAATRVMPTSYAYISPEQLSDGPTDARSDIFSLGCVFYELVTGEPAFAGPNVDAILTALRAGKFVPPGQLRSDTPVDLEIVIARMLAADPDERFQSADEVILALDGFAAEIADVTAYTLGLFGEQDPDGALDSYLAASDDVAAPVAETLADPDTQVDGQERLALLAQASMRRETGRRSTLKDPVTLVDPNDLRRLARNMELRTLLRNKVLWATSAAIVVGGIAAAFVLRGIDGETAQPPVSSVVEVGTEDAAVAEEPKSSPKEEHAANTGGISITSEPPAEVLIDGASAGRSPVRVIGLPPGEISVQLRNPELGINKTTKLDVVAGETTNHHFQVKKGRVSIEVTPWAKVFVDGRFVGTTPMEPLSLFEGAHVVRLVNRDIGVKRVVRVRVQPGKSASVVEDLSSAGAKE